ncbi:MAG: DedA family protein [Phenylobacterium sp.]|uniref:DedA family protein n=1 Tax=Phenylobacterium sp. TaxID=1871053 RepID=UPI00273596D6|nr:DedA family protein [Phenylobacterium sp.]MDP1641830.1 DedA family protein [Phenylobacterium sp.]MDP3116028.1 DedA family protein [Phenylobacterium sp.]MDZ4053736.1 DedA family protein [Phenylobacterium sp.]
MGGLAERLAALLQSHPEQAGLIVGLLVFAESLAFVGFFVPSTPLLLAIGALVGAGVVTPGPILVFAIAGAVAGDAISYELGRWMGPSALRHRTLRRHRRAVARARLFIHRAGVLAMILGRFTGPVRSFVPLVGGMLRMGRARFQVANAIGAVLWIPIMLAPGYLAARGLTLLPPGVVEPLLIALAVIGFAVMAWRWGRRRA